MASIEVVPAEVTVITEEKIVLTLTRKEARTLAVVADRIGGSPRGRRGHMDQISKALNGIGIVSNPERGLNVQSVEGEMVLANGYIDFTGDDNGW